MNTTQMYVTFISFTKVLADLAVYDWWRYCKALCNVKFSQNRGKRSQMSSHEARQQLTFLRVYCWQGGGHDHEEGPHGLQHRPEASQSPAWHLIKPNIQYMYCTVLYCTVCRTYVCCCCKIKCCKTIKMSAFLIFLQKKIVMKVKYFMLVCKQVIVLYIIKKLKPKTI